MDGLNLLPVFLVGLAGSVHCAGMCGGIVGALSAVPGPAGPAGRTLRRVIPLAQASAAHASPDAHAGHAAAATPAGTAAEMPCTARPSTVAAHAARSACASHAAGGTAARLLAYNAGRIASYMLAGAIAGGMAGGAASLSKIAAWQNAAFWLANLMLAALGLYLMNAWRGLAQLEAAGNALWCRLLPLLRPLLPVDSAAKALALGGLWGWVPCAMVYSVLLTAALSGSAARGATVMLAFGLGTLPMLATLGILGAQAGLLARGQHLSQLMRRRTMRTACGLLVLAFGMLGLLRASGAAAPLLHALGLPDAAAAHGWIDALCIGARP
jgi:sulfite exporter TauE/SafE